VTYGPRFSWQSLPDTRACRSPGQTGGQLSVVRPLLRLTGTSASMALPPLARQPRRLVTFYVDAHNRVLPHSAFRGQTPDERYFGTGDAVPADLTSRATSARRARVEANRSAACLGWGQWMGRRVRTGPAYRWALFTAGSGQTRTPRCSSVRTQQTSGAMYRLR